MALSVEGREAQRQEHGTPRSCDGEQNQGHVRASLDLGWQTQMDTGGFGPNWLSGFERMRPQAYCLERHGTKGPWSLESWLGGHLSKRPRGGRGHS